MRKFVAEVEQITYSGELAVETAQPVIYVTERCVFTVSADGLRLIEIAPGIDLERDILAHMDFEPAIGKVALMDSRLFQPAPMGLRAQLLDAPIEDRINLDESGRLVVNLRGYAVRHQGDLDAIAARVEALCAGLGHKVDMIAWYDGFSVDPALEAAYADMVAVLEKAYYRSSTRFTRNPFTRARFAAELAKREQGGTAGRDSNLTRVS